MSTSIGRHGWRFAVFKERRRRVRFAHTAPWHVSITGQPVTPRRQEIDYLIERVRKEILRNRDILSAEALAEYDEALRIYSEIAERAE